MPAVDLPSFIGRFPAVQQASADIERRFEILVGSQQTSQE
jgi:hypothetical protein